MDLTDKLLDEFLKRDLPTAAEQADNFILWLGDQIDPGQHININASADYAAVGAHFRQGLNYIIRGLQAASLLVETKDGEGSASLTFAGWSRYEELKKGRLHTKKAFMAMPFGNEELDKIFLGLKAGVSKTGFNLTRLDEKPEAGLIDNRLRVEIQTSRFLVADLTDGNQGAYWEAGFGEGLGKPVFYSCKKSLFKTHFDANHAYTLLWEETNIGKAAEELKLAIRATLPDEAKMTDD